MSLQYADARVVRKSAMSASAKPQTSKRDLFLLRNTFLFCNTVPHTFLLIFKNPNSWLIFFGENQLFSIYEQISTFFFKTCRTLTLTRTRTPKKTKSWTVHLNLTIPYLNHLLDLILVLLRKKGMREIPLIWTVMKQTKRTSQNRKRPNTTEEKSNG